MSVIETERLIIRNPCEEDLKECYKNFLHDKSLIRFSDNVFCNNFNEAYRLFDFDPCGDDWVIELKNKKKLIGMVKFSQDPYKHLNILQIGFVLGKKYRHNGYMLESCRALLNSYFNDEQRGYIDCIEAYYNANNKESENLIHALGFKEEARLKNRRIDLEKNELCDLVICSINKKTTS